MSDYAPTESEIRDAFLAQFDELDQTRTEDRHPVPEFWAWLAHEGYTIHGLDALAFAEEMFDLWERANVSEATIARYAAAADAGLAPAYTAAAIERVRSDALDEFDYMVRRHVGQPSLFRAAS